MRCGYLQYTGTCTLRVYKIYIRVHKLYVAGTLVIRWGTQNIRCGYVKNRLHETVLLSTHSI